jgi:hypothetical protein
VFTKTHLPWKSNKYYILGYVHHNLNYPACKEHEPYCRLWTVLLYHIFPYCLITGKIFGKKDIEYKMCVLISLQISCEVFLILRRTEWDIIINIQTCPCKVLVILVKFQWNVIFLGRFSNNTPITNFEKSPSSGSRVVPRGLKNRRKEGRTDRQIEIYD